MKEEYSRFTQTKDCVCWYNLYVNDKGCKYILDLHETSFIQTIATVRSGERRE